MSHVCAGDIEYGNHFTSTSSGALFTQARVAVLPREDGVVTLFNRTLKKRTGEAVEERELDEGQPYMDELRETFGFDLDASYESLNPIREHE